MTLEPFHLGLCTLLFIFPGFLGSLFGIRVGKMVLWSYLLGCAGPALTAACAMTYKDPFVLPMNAAQRKEAKSAKISLAQVRGSDWLITAAFVMSRQPTQAQMGTFSSCL